jgi:tRNA(adenine34) deaminase
MSYPLFSDEYYMAEALKEAHKAIDEDEVPVGAVVVCNQLIIARAHNMTERLNDATAHAEMQAFSAAAYELGAKYLTECTLYVTLEPCVMCAAAAYWTQIGRIVYGVKDEKKGYTLIKQELLHPRTTVISGIMEKECSLLIKKFFQTKREY